MERRIYLLRHGETVAPKKEKCCIGRTDYKLSGRGKSQSVKAGSWLSGKQIRRIYSSPQSRCVETARIVQRILEKSESSLEDKALKKTGEIIIREGLQEMSVGEWENMPFLEIQTRYPQEYKERGRQIGLYAPPGGESFLQAGIRFEQCLNKIRKESEDNILIVSHSGVIRGYLCQILDISPNSVFELSQPCGGVTILKEQWGDKITVEEK